MMAAAKAVLDGARTIQEGTIVTGYVGLDMNSESVLLEWAMNGSLVR